MKENNLNIPESHIKHEYFQTPDKVVDKLFNNEFLINHFKPNAKYFDPCCGSQAFAKGLKRRFNDFNTQSVTQIEIRQEDAVNGVIHADFLTWTPNTDLNIDYVISNPPFSLAEKFIEHSLELFPNAEIWFLLPITFLGSKKRKDLINRLNPSIFILSERPSFLTHSTQRSIHNFTYFGFNLPKSFGIKSI
jgi:hypothetical protein